MLDLTYMANMSTMILYYMPSLKILYWRLAGAMEEYTSMPSSSRNTYLVEKAPHP